ncbi:hypothetical protein BKA70DRAFT_1558703 [Coprinopsis sp. MPI-PUGE-AT-0042]|nr:hypothetical protein BKA70DRAFT_1558703 [Coprinopsis sp. MPI-PUGE-AT-0042]
MPRFPNAQNISISGGQFNDVSGNQTNHYDNSRTEIRGSFNTNNNAFYNSFNDNSFHDNSFQDNSRHDNSFHDNSFHDNSRHDNSYHDNSYHDNSYHDNSRHDNSYHDNSRHDNSFRGSSTSRSPPAHSTSLLPSAAAKLGRLGAGQRAGHASRSSGFTSRGDFSTNSFDQSYHDKKDQSVRDSNNSSSNSNEDRSTHNNQDYRDQSRRVDSSKHTINDNRRYDNSQHDNRRYDGDDTIYDNRQSDRHNRSSIHNGPSTKTTNTDNLRVNPNSVSGGLTNSGVISPKSPKGQKSTNGFSAPVKTKSRDDVDFASNSYSARTSRSVTPTPATPRPDEQRRSRSVERRKLEATLPQRLSDDRLARPRTASQDALSYVDAPSPSSHLSPTIQNSPLAESPERLRASPQPVFSNQDLPPESSASPSHPQFQQQRARVDQASGSKPHSSNTAGSVAHLMEGLLVQGEEETETVWNTPPAAKERRRKRDLIKRVLFCM